jgi:uncharacterized protein (TIGR03067 family)
MNDNPEDQQNSGQSSEDVPGSQPRLSDIQPGTPPVAPITSPDSRIQGGSIRLFRVSGIDVFLHWSWFFFALLRLESTHRDDPYDFVHYESQVWYAVEYLALFGLVLLHEFGHVLACRSVGGVANRIVLWPLGGVALVDPPARPSALLWTIAGGPLVNVLLAVPTIGLWLAFRAAGVHETAPDLFRFAIALAWTNGYLLLFNMLPVYPLDGGRILQALLWFVMGRARSLLVAAMIGVITTVGIFVVAIVDRSFAWGILAAFGLLFCLLGIQTARALIRALDATRRKGHACPGCGAAPPIGRFWSCPRCLARFDAFATGGNCPNCSTPLAAVHCHACDRSRPYAEWYREGLPPDALNTTNRPLPAQAVPAASQPTSRVRPPTVVQRVVWGTIFAALGLACCGLPNLQEQPLGLIVWTAGGAILGAARAGSMTRMWRNAWARQKLSGTWRLAEEDGQTVRDDEQQPRRLILNGPTYEERIGKRRDVRGVCWTDPQAEPPAISFTPSTGPDAGKPRPGIYSLKGGVLTVCMAYPDNPRPTAFVAQPAVQKVRVYRRGKKNPDPKQGRAPM